MANNGFQSNVQFKDYTKYLNIFFPGCLLFDVLLQMPYLGSVNLGNKYNIESKLLKKSDIIFAVVLNFNFENEMYNYFYLKMHQN